MNTPKSSGAKALGNATREIEEAHTAGHDAGPKTTKTHLNSREIRLVRQVAEWFRDGDNGDLPWHDEPPIVTRGRWTKAACIACDKSGPHRHHCMIAHFVDLPGEIGSTVSLLGGTICPQCANNARAGDEGWLEAFKERRRAGVRDRTMTALLAVSPADGGVQ